MDKIIETPEQVIAELRGMHNQFLCPQDTYFGSMADVVEKLLNATQALVDVQNGPPLHKYHDDWHDAMIEVCEATGLSEDAQWYREQKGK